MKIGIIIGSVRERRIGGDIGEWVHQQTRDRPDATYELLDLREFDVPLLTTGTHPMQANKRYDSDAVTRWSRAIDTCDAYVFCTPEYNHGVPGALKNAVDSLGPEWVGKPIGFVGYGSVGGVRAIEHWRTVVVNFSMVPVRAELNLSLFTDVKDGSFAPSERRADELSTLCDQLEAATRRVGAES